MGEQNKLLHFLLVEDDIDHAYLIKRSMKQSRMANTLDHVMDGAAALHYLEQKGEFADAVRPDLILLDLKLPKVDGHEVLARVKENPALMSIPVVILTTSAAEADRINAYAHHANSYIVKPLDGEGFRTIIDELSLYWGAINVGPPESSKTDSDTPDP